MISILTVLELIKDSNTESGTHPFSIRYIKQNGEVGIKHKAVQHAKMYNKTVKPAGGSGLQTNLKETANLLLYDLVQQTPFNIPFYALIEFNGTTIHHE